MLFKITWVLFFPFTDEIKILNIFARVRWSGS